MAASTNYACQHLLAQHRDTPAAAAAAPRYAARRQQAPTSTRLRAVAAHGNSRHAYTLDVTAINALVADALLWSLWNAGILKFDKLAKQTMFRPRTQRAPPHACLRVIAHHQPLPIACLRATGETRAHTFGTPTPAGPFIIA